MNQPPGGWGPPNQPPPGYPPHPGYGPPPPQVVYVQAPPVTVQQTSGCSTALWFVLLIFVIIPAAGLMSCVVCAHLGR